MQLEIQVALKFIISYLYHKLPRRRVDIFSEELERRLRRKYEGHWYPDQPYKGSGFRCLHVGERVEPLVEEAARESGLVVSDIRAHLPAELSVWIDPFEVSYQIGEAGPVRVLYLDEAGEGTADLDHEIGNSFNPDARVFLPIVDVGVVSSESSSPSPPVPRLAQPLTFTTAAFAATKFGSTKMRNAARGGAKVAQASPTHLNLNLMKQKGVSGSLYGVTQKSSALSPNAKEFIFPSMPSPGVESPPQYGHTPDIFAAYDKTLVDGLKYSNQQFQPVMAN